MKETIPNELVALYGTIAISRIATVRTNATLTAMPEVQEALNKVSKDTNTPKKISLSDFDVENGGMDQEYEDFMTAGFETLIPAPGGMKPRPFPIPRLPEGVRICGKILRGLRIAEDEREVQREAAEKLQALVNALSKSSHPLVLLFAALFKAALQEVQDRLQELNDLITALRRSAAANDC